MDQDYQEYLESLLQVVRALNGLDLSKPIRINKRLAQRLEREGWTEECKHHKGEYTMSKVTLAFGGKHLQLLCDVYEAGRDDGYDSAYADYE